MINLDSDKILNTEISSSKGDQLKWFNNNVWYKADKNGYEGLSEYVISKLLKKTSLDKNEYVDYELESIKYKNQIFNGCKSNNFLNDNESIITLEKLYRNTYGTSLTNKLIEFDSYKNKTTYLVNEVEKITGLDNFGSYLYKILVIDALFLNEDRHLHNIAVIKRKNSYDYCPIFDNGAALLSDINIDYPLKNNVIEYIKDVKAKTIGPDFIEAYEDVEGIFGSRIEFNFTSDDVDRLVDKASMYEEKVRKRVKQLIKYQMNKMKYFF